MEIVLAESIVSFDSGWGFLTSDNVYEETVLITIAGTESLNPVATRYKTVLEAFSSLDGFGYNAMGKLVGDGFGVSVVTGSNVGKLAHDYLLSTDTLLSKWVGSVALAEALAGADIAVETLAYLLTLAESAALAETLTGATGITRTDSFRAVDATVCIAKFYRTLAVSLMLSESIASYPGVMELVTETGSFSDAPVGNIGKRLLEVISAMTTTSSSVAFNRSVAELLYLADTIIQRKGYSDLVAESLTATDVLTALVWLTCASSDSVNALGSVSTNRTASPVLASSIAITAATTAIGHFPKTVAETINLRLTITINGIEYQCWSFADDAMYASLYTNYGFTSFATMGGRNYGTRADGIYLLEGADDAGDEIQTGIRVNFAAMGTHQRKRLFHAFFGLVGTRPVVKLITDNGEDEYYVVEGKIHTAKGLCGVKWELILTQIDALEFIEIQPVVLMR